MFLHILMQFLTRSAIRRWHLTNAREEALLPEEGLDRDCFRLSVPPPLLFRRFDDDEVTTC